RLLIFASVVTLALNVAEPLVAGEFGKTAFDAVGPLLLIGWSEVGPGLLQAIGATSRTPVAHDVDRPEPAVDVDSDAGASETQADPLSSGRPPHDPGAHTREATGMRSQAPQCDKPSNAAST